MKKITALFALFSLIFAAGSSVAAPAPDSDWTPSLSAIVKDTQKSSDIPGRVTFVWWIPGVFWEVSLKQNNTSSPEEAENFMKIVRDYTLVLVVDGEMDDRAMANFRSEDEVVADVIFLDRSGMPVHSLPDSEVSNAFKGVLGSIRPVLSGIIGNMGENMVFLAFPAADAKGVPLADPYAEQTFSVVVRGEAFKWHLPLESLFAPVACEKCAAVCNGSWKFCPWCGTKLTKAGENAPEKKAEAPAPGSK
jgi:hypothetical protein